jgi:hypothetical protein
MGSTLRYSINTDSTWTVLILGAWTSLPRKVGELDQERVDSLYF